MIVLAIDTCDARGSVAILRGEEVIRVAVHDSTEDYSSWLLPAVAKVLGSSDLEMKDVGGYAVAAGPGSFTGVRVGLTTVKAWSEVYGRPVAAVSRLEAIGIQASAGKQHVGAFADAQRGQVFGAVYVRHQGGLERIGDEMVISPGKFVQTAGELAEGGGISWVSPDPSCVVAVEEWGEREKAGESIDAVSCVLAPVIGRIGGKRLAAGEFTDALRLDANYVRRSDAEILWKDSLRHGR